MKFGSCAVAVLCAALAASPLGVAQALAGQDRGARELRFDFPGLQVGIAEYAEGPTGCTVFLFPDRAMVTADVRGGSPGTTGTDAVRLGYEAAFVDAIVFAGGSAYGLAAADGVRSELLASGRRGVRWGNIASVLGAIIYDFGVRANTIHPDRELGQAALRAAVPGVFPLGARGAGRSATVGKLYGRAYMEHAGQGGAFVQVGPTRIAVFTVVNSVGVLVDRAGRAVRGNRDPRSGVRSLYSQDLASGAAAGKRKAVLPPLPEPRPDGVTGNTTITLLLVNQKLGYADLQRLAVQTHTAMARAIQPFQTRNDGDVLFAASTGEVENPELHFDDLAVVAGELAWDAVLASYDPR